jgi:tRNA dimethylallyltransferase
VEVIRLTGRPFSAQRAAWTEPPRSALHAQRSFGFTRSANDLHHRINARVDRMFAAGLVDETRRLLERGLAQNKTALQAIGYRQVVEHLGGERPLGETIERVKARTRQFAKRQMTWFRRQLELQWIELSPGDSPAAVAALVKARLKKE